ncbi:MAG: response regulator transcription factor [Saprospiraceae bacterium]|nr:response regulator transcription factor [Saprospiraceae bacterium]MBK7790887.1 response regulator transcription factor [Saprospiraceae bacterium]MBK8109484.1 response regulator transcription factor [Saprospiraceae bacterium]MBL0084143.1 response regulator transcription factor [Saprospiraceae bacterium]
MNKARILYVEDDETLSFVTSDNLSLNGYDVVHCLDGESALTAFGNGHFDLCLLDVMLPKKDGFSLASDIRKKNPEIPILFLTAKSMKEDRINGLKLGADDYITKPFSIEELILKIEVFLKRKFINIKQANKFTIGKLTFDYKNLTISAGDSEKTLTQREADLLKLLIENKNNVIKREEILERVWGQNDYFLGRSMDVFISRLRKYLSDDENLKIDNIHGVGFKLIAP